MKLFFEIYKKIDTYVVFASFHKFAYYDNYGVTRDL